MLSQATLLLHVYTLATSASHHTLLSFPAATSLATLRVYEVGVCGR